MKLNYQLKKRKESKSLKRFYTSRDMAELKRMEAISYAEAKRGEHTKHTNISVCGCGMEGCFLLSARYSNG